jgi:hypothetical protein
LVLVATFLLCGAPAAFAGHEHDLSRPDPIQGEIVLTDTPFCGYFVVETDQGFSLLRWRGEMEVFAEGDKVQGPLHAAGLQRIEHVLEPRLLAAIGPLFTLVQIDDWGVDLRRAQEAYYEHCHPGAVLPQQQQTAAAQ